MKHLLPMLFILAACSATTTHLRPVCSQNYNYCVASFYTDNQAPPFCKERGYDHCAREDWVALCKNDLQVCQGE
jgi:hypothetical protein